ncbi:MAG TPA: hypothetical protein VMB26_16975 [Candidatus Binataceae bacterium]|nr:hypothetical protein [Candidatus Binataceae bacterium]
MADDSVVRVLDFQNEMKSIFNLKSSGPPDHASPLFHKDFSKARALLI